MSNARLPPHVGQVSDADQTLDPDRYREVIEESREIADEEAASVDFCGKDPLAGAAERGGYPLGCGGDA